MGRQISRELRRQVEGMPASSGIYLMKDLKGHIIYVGKAKNLNERVRSYFGRTKTDGRRRFRKLMETVARVDYLVTSGEQEALALEAHHIRESQPRFNVRLKHAKGLPYVRRTDEPFPRIFSTRDIVDDGSKYLGPFTNARALDNTLKVMHQLFPVRTCDCQLLSTKRELCMDYHLHRCQGPCQRLVDKEEYAAVIDRAWSFLQGRNSEVIRDLRRQMKRAAAGLRYESAALLRDQLASLESTRARQKVFFDDSVDRDVFGLATNDEEGCCSVLEIREGRFVGEKHHYLNGCAEIDESQILSAFIRQFYLDTTAIPAEIHVSTPLPDKESVRYWLRSKSKSAIRIATPRRGLKLTMLEMAKSNAVHRLEEKRVRP